MSHNDRRSPRAARRGRSTLLREWLRPEAPKKPTRPIPTEARTARDFADVPEHGVRITWLGHATSIVEVDGARFLVDPVWAERASPVPWLGPRRFFAPPRHPSHFPQA